MSLFPLAPTIPKDRTMYSYSPSVLHGTLHRASARVIFWGLMG